MCRVHMGGEYGGVIEIKIDGACGVELGVRMNMINIEGEGVVQ